MRLLITGATGLIGSHISELCKELGFQVNYLTTSKKKIEKLPHYKGFFWDPKNDVVDEKCFSNIDAIIHLAGASVAKRWTSSYKKEIIDSRVKTADLLYKKLLNSDSTIPHFISASGISIYPDSRQKLYFEDEPRVENSFIGEVVQLWESSADEFKGLGMEVTKIRTGMVLAKESGALPKMRSAVSLNLGAGFGSGKQWQSWIHIEDIAGVYLHVAQNKMGGVYNAVAPNPVTNIELIKEIAAQKGKSIWLPNIPASALKLALGEMATVVLSSQLVSSNKIEKTGFDFRYKNISKALKNLVN